MIENGQPGGGFVLCYGGDRIPFQVAFRPRRRLAITVHPDLRVEVSAPTGSVLDQVLARVEKRAAWIVKQRRHFEPFQPARPGPRFVSGETHLYLGRQYRLKVQVGAPRGVKLIGRFLHVFARDRDDPKEVQTLLEDWYRRHAKRIFAHRLQLCLEASRWLELPAPPGTIVRKLAKRWGSCTKKGNVLLNLDLVQVPVHCIDYVIAHELCHLKVHSHGRAFYRLLTRVMPDWDKRKARLESFVL